MKKNVLTLVFLLISFIYVYTSFFSLTKNRIYEREILKIRNPIAFLHFLKFKYLVLGLFFLVIGFLLYTNFLNILVSILLSTLIFMFNDFLNKKVIKKFYHRPNRANSKVI